MMKKLAIDSRRRVIIPFNNDFTLQDIKAHLEGEGMHILKTSMCLLLKKTSLMSNPAYTCEEWW